MERLNKVVHKVGKFIIYLACASIICLSVLFAVTLFRPVDVIKNWTLTSTQHTYRPGDTVTLVSKLDKLMSVDGEPHRTLVCTSGSTEERFDLPVGLANRAAGTYTTELSVALPFNLQSLPRICHINISVDYNIYGYREYQEFVDSNDFTVIGR